MPIHRLIHSAGSAKAALALIAAALFLQGCATNYYACRQEGRGIDACDEMSRGGRLG